MFKTTSSNLVESRNVKPEQDQTMTIDGPISDRFNFNRINRHRNLSFFLTNLWVCCNIVSCRCVRNFFVCENLVLPQTSVNQVEGVTTLFLKSLPFSERPN